MDLLLAGTISIWEAKIAHEYLPNTSISDSGLEPSSSLSRSPGKWLNSLVKLFGDFVRSSCEIDMTVDGSNGGGEHIRWRFCWCQCSWHYCNYNGGIYGQAGNFDPIHEPSPNLIRFKRVCVS